MTLNKIIQRDFFVFAKPTTQWTTRTIKRMEKEENKIQAKDCVGIVLQEQPLKGNQQGWERTS